MYFLTGKTLSGVVGFLILMLLVRALEASEYGLFIVMLAMFEILQLGSNMGCYPAAYRYVPELNSGGYFRRLQRLVGVLLAIRAGTLILVAGIVATISPFLFKWLGFNWFPQFAWFYPAFLFFEGINRYIDQLFDALMLQGMSQTATLLRNSTRLLGLLTFGVMGVEGVTFDIKLWLMIEAGASFFGLVIASGLLQHAIKQKLAGVAVDADNELDVKRMLSYVGPAYGAQLVWLGQGPDVVKMLIARISDSVQVGAFGFCAALNAMLQRYLPVYLLIGMVRPVFVSAREKGRTHRELVGLASLVFKLNLFLLCPLLVAALIKGDTIISILSGGRFLGAGGYLAAFIALLIFQSLHMVMSLLAMVMENGKAMLKAMSWGLIGIGAGLAGVQWFGPMALACGLILSEVIRCCVVQLSLKQNDVTFRTEMSSLIKFVSASVLSGAMLLLADIFVDTQQLPGLVFALAMMGMVYMGFSLLLKPFLAQERSQINKVLPKPLFVF